MLPLDVWNHRAEVEELALKLGRFPMVYEHALNVMLPKAEGDTELKHRGITLFSVLHRILAGAYWMRLQQCQNEWIHPALFGGRKGGGRF